MEAHLDLIGGIAGDMFIAAILDAFPHFADRVREAIAAVDDTGRIDSSLTPCRDGAFHGQRFQVRHLMPAVTSSLVARREDAHTSWRSIHARLEAAPLAAGTRRHAIAIFDLLAQAEARVHGVAPPDVTFHEVGAWDSIADIVGAAELITALDATHWSTSPAPLGSGRARTAHGIVAVPAPATTLLLQGMAVIDDGISGERVTPTGAAILRHLCPPTPGKPVMTGRAARILSATGSGFGQRSFAGVSNQLRLLCFLDAADASGGRRSIDVLEFEIDDQSGEDLALGLDRLRGHEAVLDVTQTAVFGKKNRLMVHIRVLVRHGHAEEVSEACFSETTTIGMRHHTVAGIGLSRNSQSVTIDGRPLRVKVVKRPGGLTAKAEADDLLPNQNHARRARLRRRAERAALKALEVDIDA